MTSSDTRRGDRHAARYCSWRTARSLPHIATIHRIGARLEVVDDTGWTPEHNTHEIHYAVDRLLLSLTPNRHVDLHTTGTKTVGES